MDRITAAWDAAAAKKKIAEMEFIKANPQSTVSAWVITRSFIFQPDLAALESLYDGLSPAVQASSLCPGSKRKDRKGKAICCRTAGA